MVTVPRHRRRDTNYRPDSVFVGKNLKALSVTGSTGDTRQRGTITNEIYEIKDSVLAVVVAVPLAAPAAWITARPS